MGEVYPLMALTKLWKLKPLYFEEKRRSILGEVRILLLFKLRKNNKVGLSNSGFWVEKSGSSNSPFFWRSLMKLS